MSRISCEIIEDLLPLYTEDICSEESKRAVQEHLAECEKCRALSERMGAPELKVEEKASEELDYMRKLKRHIYRREGVCLAGFVFLLLLLLLPVWENRAPGLLPQIYYAILPAAAVILYGISSGYTVKLCRNRWKVCLLAAALVLWMYTVSLPFFAIHWVQDGTGLFGMQPQKLGPFFHNQFSGLFVLQLIVMAAAVFISACTGSSTSLIQTIGMTGTCMALALSGWLGRLDTLETAVAVKNEILIVLSLEGAILAVLFQILDRKRVTEKRNSI